MMGSGPLGAFSRARARRAEGEATHTTFADVAGIDDAKDELAEIVDYLRRPERYRRAAVLWSVVAMPPVVALIVLRPWLCVAGLAYAVLFGINLWFAKAGAERSLTNDLVLVAECTAMVPLMVGVAAGADGLPVDATITGEVGVLTAVCVLLWVSFRRNDWL